MVAVCCVIANIVERNRNNISLARSVNDTLRKWPREHLREQGKDIKVNHTLNGHLWGLIKVRLFKLAQFFRTFIDALKSENLSGIIQRLRAIVTQSDHGQEAAQQAAVAQKEFRNLRNVLPVATRLGFAGVVIVIIWWSWPMQNNFAPATRTRLVAPTQTTTNPDTLNILNPADLPSAQVSSTPTDTATDTALPSIVTLSNNPVDQDQAAQPALQANAAISPGLPLSVTTALDNLAQQPVLEREEPAAGMIVAAQENRVLVPTVTPADEPAVGLEDLPKLRVLPAFGIELPPTPEPELSPTPAPLPTRIAVPLNIEPGRLWSTFTPHATANDHFWVARPFAPSVPNQLASPSYQFGSTAGNHYRTHHGVDIPNIIGTPVLAATDGEVVHAGPDDKILLGPYNNFYGNSVVIRLDRRLPVAGGKLDVYLLYGHLSQVNVAVGQRVHPEDVVGLVGMTGIAIGPHLHVEMRLGANTYQHSINPYLWLQPLEGTGAVAVRLLTADGRTLPGAGLTLARFDNGIATWARLIETYRDTENIGPDPAWGENGAMDGVPAGYYILVGVVNGESIRTDLTVRAGETSFVEIRTKQ
jgi:murein DD-endopeptidase MepM/ murein hydrolase activator NlpD